jgi:hypothetical protein
VLLVLAAACGSPQPRPKPAGFLGDYSDFQPDPDTGALRYQNPDADLARYDRVMLDPVVVALAEGSGGAAVDPEDLAALARYMRDAMEIALRGAYPLAEEPGPDVLRVRIAITDLVPNRTTLNTASTLLIPGRLASRAKRAVTGTDLFVGQVSIEAEALDSESGTRLIAVVDRKAGDGLVLRDSNTTWGHVQRAFREWAVRFRLTLDRAHRNATRPKSP